MKSIRTAYFAALCVAGVGAQTLVTYSPMAPAPAAFGEVAGTSPMFPGGGPPQGVFGALFPLPPAFPGPAPVVVPPGDVAIDAVTGRLFVSNGPLIAAQPNPTYVAPLAPPVPPFPAPPFPPLPFVAAGGAWVSGLAVNPAPGLLWMTNGFMVQAIAIAPLPAMVVVFPPFAPAVPIAAFGPMTGLEWDGATGTLLACDAAGTVISFLPGGAFGGLIVPPPGVLPGPATGVTIDKTTLPSPAGPRSLYVTAGGMIFDYSAGVVLPSLVGPAVGVAFHGNPARLSPGGCPCGGLAPALQTLSPSYSGNPAFGVDWAGLPPFAGVIVAFDLAFDPAFPMINFVGCPLIMDLVSPSLFIFPAAANAAGRLSLPVSLVGLPPGVAFYVQYVTGCTADPTGLMLSSGMQVTVTAL